jgi:predicted dehydrogenase
VEDNAVALFRGADGAVGIAEAGFVNRHSPFTVEVHGTEGSLLYGTPEAKLLLRTGPGDGAAGERWSEVPLPEGAPKPFDQWVEHIEQDTRPTENLALARDLTVLMEAAYRSVREGRETTL